MSSSRMSARWSTKVVDRVGSEASGHTVTLNCAGAVPHVTGVHLADGEVRSSMADELIAQTFINKSDDYAEFRAARAEEREPHYTGS